VPLVTGSMADRWQLLVKAGVALMAMHDPWLGVAPRDGTPNGTIAAEFGVKTASAEADLSKLPQLDRVCRNDRP